MSPIPAALGGAAMVRSRARVPSQYLCSPPTPQVGVMVPKIMALQPKWAASVGAAKAEVAAGGEGEGSDEARGLCRLFTEMGESYIKLILSPEPLNQVAVVQMVLDCTSHPDVDIGTIPLWFWWVGRG